MAREGVPCAQRAPPLRLASQAERSIRLKAAWGSVAHHLMGNGYRWACCVALAWLAEMHSVYNAQNSIRVHLGVSMHGPHAVRIVNS